MSNQSYNLRVRNYTQYENESENVKVEPEEKLTKKLKKVVKIEHVENDYQPKVIPPANWEMVYRTIKCYRMSNEAPVDTMGCAQTDNKEIQGKDYRFHVLLSLILSSRTKDEATFQAMANIKSAINGPFNIHNVSQLSSDKLHQCINKVGFHNQKLNFIQKSIQVCLQQYNGDIPNTLEGLLNLPGVGPKMAYLVLQNAWNENAGIGVDIHVDRICNRLKWVRTKTPEETRNALESWLPKSYWKEINSMLVGFGQTICQGQRPKCGQCPVQNYCPSRQGTAVYTKVEATDTSEESQVKIEYETLQL